MSIQPEFRLLLGHRSTIIPDRETGYITRDLFPAITNGPIPRAFTHPPRRAGTVRQGSEEVDFYHITLGGPVDLPPPEPNVYLIVSKYTIQAVLREGSGRTIDDLLFLYGDIRDKTPDGREIFKGVRGLGRPQPQERKQAWIQLPQGGGRQVENACPYPIKRYSADTPELVPPGCRPIAVMPTAPAEKQLRLEYSEDLDVGLSKRLGIPVYDTTVIGVIGYEPSVRTPDKLRIVNPNVIMALGIEAVGAGLGVVVNGVRDMRTRTHLGGTAYGMPDESVMCSHLI